jgi:TP901 family phage tail tape measure protein
VAESFSQVIEVALRATTDPSLRALLTDLRELGTQGELTDEQLGEVTNAVQDLNQQAAAASGLQSSIAALEQYRIEQERVAEAVDKSALRLKLAAEQEAASAAALDASKQALAEVRAERDRYNASEERTAEGTRQFAASLKEAQAAQKGAQTEYANASATLRQATTEYDRAVTAQDRLSAGIGKSEDAIRAAGLSVDDLASAQSELQLRLQQTGTTTERLAANLREQVAINQQAAAAARQNAAAQQALADANQTLGRRGFGEVRAEIEKVRQAYDTLRRSGQLSVQELAQAQSRAIERTRELRAEYGSLGNSLRQVQGSLIAAGASLFATTRLLSDAARTSSEFSTAIAEVSTLLDDTSGITALSDSVKALARDFGGPASAQARALYQIISAGATNAADANRILAQSNRLAIAGVSDLQTAADGITSVLNAYGLAASDAESVSDSLFAAVRAGKTTVDELGASIGQVAPIAATAGVEFDELAATIATLTQGGVATAKAVTQIRAVLSSVIKPTQDAKDAADELGINFSLAAVRSQGLAGFLAEVAEKAGDNDEALSRLFGSVEGLQAVFSLVGQQAGNFERNLASVADAAGATQAAFEKIDDTPAQRLARFSASVDQLKISFGDAVSSLAPVLDGLSGLLNVFNELPGSVRTGAAGVVALSAVIAPLAIAIVQSRAALVLLLGSLRAIGPAAAGAGAGVGVFTTAATGAAAASGRLTASLGGLSRAFAVLGAAAVGFEVGTALNEPLTRYRLSVDEAAQSTVRFAVDVDAIGQAGAEAASRFANFGDVAVKTAGEVQQLGESQREAYREALDGLNAFLRGRAEELIAQQRSTELTAEQRAELQELFKRLDQVRKGYVDLNSAALGAAESVAEIGRSADSAEVTKLADEIRRAAREGGNLEAAIAGAFDGVDFENEAGRLGRIALAFEEAGRTAGEAGRQIRDGIAKEIEALSGRELLRFQQAAQFAFDSVGKSGSSAAAALNQTFEQAVRRLGVSFEAAGIKISEEGGNIIATFETLSQSALANANAIEQGFTGALAKVSTSAEVEALGQALATAADQGKISAQQYDQALQQIQQRLAQIQGQSAAIQPPAPPPPNVADGYRQIAEAATDTGEAAKTAAEGIEQSNDAAAAGGGFSALYAQQLLTLREEFAETSQAAVDLFLGYQKLAARGGAGSDLIGLLDSLAAAGEQTRRELRSSRTAADDLAGSLSAVTSATDLAAFQASEFGARFSGSAEGASEELARLLLEIEAVENGVSNAASGLQFLDKATLENLKRQADGAAQAINRIEDAARAAQQQLDELERRLQDEADAASGNEEAIKRREFEDELRRIEELAAAGGTAAQQQAERLKRLAEQAFARDLQQIRDRERAQVESDNRVRDNRERNASGGGGAGAGSGGGIDPLRAQPERRQSAQNPRGVGGDGPAVQFIFNGPTLGTPEDLARDLRKQFDKLDRIGNNPRR